MKGEGLAAMQAASCVDACCIDAVISSAQTIGVIRAGSNAVLTGNLKHQADTATKVLCGCTPSCMQSSTSLSGQGSLLYRPVPFGNPGQLRCPTDTNWFQPGKTDHGNEFVTSNDKPRIVAYRYIIEASIDVS
jgi:hypothetical protein